jgi:hypothetical protein
MSNEGRYRQRLSTFAANWRALALRGIVALLFGLVVLFWPGLVLAVLALLFGLYSVVDGAITFVPALRTSDQSTRRWLPLAEGAVGIIAGLLALLARTDHRRPSLRHRRVGGGDWYAQNTHRNTVACRGGEWVATGRKRRLVGAPWHTSGTPGRCRCAVPGAARRCLRCGGWPGPDRIRLPFAGAGTMRWEELVGFQVL